jgi:hypothetical protein
MWMAGFAQIQLEKTYLGFTDIMVPGSPELKKRLL